MSEPIQPLKKAMPVDLKELKSKSDIKEEEIFDAVVVIELNPVRLYLLAENTKKFVKESKLQVIIFS